MAFIKLTETSQIATAWLVNYDGGDVMAMVYRDDATAPWRLTVRIRSYVDRKVFGSDDRKCGYETAGRPDDASRDEFVTGADNVMQAYAAKADGHVTRIVVNGDANAFTKQWAKLPSVHVRIESVGPERPQ